MTPPTPSRQQAVKRRTRMRWRRFRFVMIVVSVLAVLPWAIDGFWRWRYPYPAELRPLIEQAAAANELDPLLVAAVIRVESRFNPEAVSAVGARGLMQLMPATAEWAAQKQGLSKPSLNDLHRPELNVRLGCWYLHYLIKSHKDVAEALAAYNGGEGNVARWRQTGGGIPFPETRSYVQRSLKAYERYQTLYGETR